MTMKFHLAPLEGISDCAFRTLCFELGADVTYTEMIRVDGILRNNKSTLSLLDFKNDTPTVLQLLISKTTSAQKFVEIFPTLNIKPVGINLNLGCPSPDVICEGSGAALIKRPTRVNDIVTILKKLNLPITVKLRLGLNQSEKDKKLYLNLITQVDANAFIVHARHAKQNSFEPADWSVLPELVRTGKKIIANGDIKNIYDLKKFEDAGIQEVMLARMAMRNPAVFQIMKGKFPTPISDMTKRYEELAKQYRSHPKYRENFLKYLGRDAQMKSG